MDKNRIAGSIEEVKGAAKEAIGKAVGDAKLQNDGKVDKAVGKIQNARRWLERRSARCCEEAIKLAVPTARTLLSA